MHFLAIFTVEIFSFQASDNVYKNTRRKEFLLVMVSDADVHMYSIMAIITFVSSINRTTLQWLGEKCPNTELFLVRIFLYSD